MVLVMFTLLIIGGAETQIPPLDTNSYFTSLATVPMIHFYIPLLITLEYA